MKPTNEIDEAIEYVEGWINDSARLGKFHVNMRLNELKILVNAAKRNRTPALPHVSAEDKHLKAIEALLLKRLYPQSTRFWGI